MRNTLDLLLNAPENKTQKEAVGKLKRDQLIQIPALKEEGLSNSEIADLFDVTSGSIRNAIKNKRWEQFDEEGQAARCPDCGGMVLDDSEPCRLCSMRRRAKNERESNT